MPEAPSSGYIWEVGREVELEVKFYSISKLLQGKELFYSTLKRTQVYLLQGIISILYGVDNGLVWVSGTNLNRCLSDNLRGDVTRLSKRLLAM